MPIDSKIFVLAVRSQDVLAWNQALRKWRQRTWCRGILGSRKIRWKGWGGVGWKGWNLSWECLSVGIRKLFLKFLKPFYLSIVVKLPVIHL